jgi:hypothetical protein
VKVVTSDGGAVCRAICDELCAKPVIAPHRDEGRVRRTEN